METKDVLILLLLSINLVTIGAKFFMDKKFYEYMYQNLKSLVHEEDKIIPNKERRRKWKSSRKKYLLINQHNEIIARGTILEISKKLGVKKDTVVHYAMPSYLNNQNVNRKLVEDR